MIPSSFLLAENKFRSKKVRIRDLVHINSMRPNKLLGYGVVFGLPGTGDSASVLMTRKAAAHMLIQMGVDVKTEDLISGSFASVLATAELPAYSRSGDTLDIRISINGDAKSLAGGTLLMTPLKAGDGLVYVVAQGPVVMRKDVDTEGILTVGKVIDGGLVERPYLPEILNDEQLET